MAILRNGWRMALLQEPVVEGWSERYKYLVVEESPLILESAAECS